MELSNYPNLSQRTAKTNGAYDCVPTSILDGLEFLTGKQFDIDATVTAAYGPNYHGFTSAGAFVPFCASHGVKLFSIDGDNATLVQDLHQQIKDLHPCLLSEPDVYAPLHPTWSHVLSVYKEDAGTLTARDPYSTIDVEHTDAEWVKLLEYREIWAMELILPPGIPTGWHWDGTNLIAPNKVVVPPPFEAYIRSRAWEHDNYPIRAEYHTALLEDSDPDLGPGMQMIFLKSMLGIPDAPKNAVAHLKGQVVEEYIGVELEHYRQKITAVLTQNAQLMAFYKEYTSQPIG